MYIIRLAYLEYDADFDKINKKKNENAYYFI